MRPAAAHLGILLASLSTACCATTRPRSAFPDANAALDRMHASLACANGVQGEAKVDNFSPQGRIRGKVYLLAVVPDRVRIDAEAFGNMVYSLSSDGRAFQMLDVRQKEFLHGPATPCNLARLTQVPIPGHALVSLLMGEAPVLVHQPQGATIAWDDKGFYRVALESTRQASEEIHLEVRPEDVGKPWSEQRVRVRNVRVTQAGIDLYEAKLDDFKPVHTAGPRVDPDGIDPPIPPSGPACDAELPWSIRMQVPHTEQDVLFVYKDAKWNPPLVANAFTQTPPGGVRTQYVTCDKEATP
jgi:hypothetical protein